MLIRPLGIIIILALIGFAVAHVIKLYREEQAKAQDKKSDNFALLKAIEKSRVEYLEIRRQWINYSLGATPSYYGNSMNDMSIPEVAQFQKLMVAMNEKYGELQDVDLDASFATKTTALKAGFDRAVLEAKKHNLE